MPVAAGSTFYSNVVGAASNSTIETQPQMGVRPAGTFTNLWTNVSANTLTVTATVRLRKNTANVNNVLSIGTTLTGTFEDTSSSDSFADGDLLSLSQVSPAGSGTITYRTHSLIFDASTNTRTQCSTNGTTSIAVASTTRYRDIMGQRDATSMAVTTESTVQTLFKSVCTLKNLYCYVTANARTATTVRTRINSVNGAQSLSITASTTGRFEDTTNSDSVAVDDLVSFSLTTGTGTATLSIYNFAVTIESTTDATYLISCQAATAAINFGDTYYSGFGNLSLANAATLAETFTSLKSRMGANTTLRNLTFRNSANTVNGASSFKIRKNGADTTLVCSIGSSTTGSFSDTSNTETVASTDLINYSLVIGGSSGTMTYRTANAELVPAAAFVPTPVMTQVVLFQKDSSGTASVTQDIQLNFTPKAIMLLSAGSNTYDSFADHAQFIQGFSDGTNHASVAMVARDASATGETGSVHRNDSVFVRLSETAITTESARATCSFSTNKVTFTWTLNDTNNPYITLIAFGGDDITNAKVNTTAIGVNTAPTTADYTGLGFTVTPSNGALFTMSGSTTTANSAIAGGFFSSGVAASSTKRYSLSNAWESTGGTTDTWRYTSSTRCLLAHLSTGTIDYYADFDSWISDGFRLEFEDAASSTSQLFSYLVINGGTWDVGTETTLTTADTSENTTVAANSQPIRGMGTGITGDNFITTTTPSNQGHIGIGFSNGESHGWVGAGHRDGLAAAQTCRRISHTPRVLGVNGTIVGSAASTPFDIDADLSSFGTNQFTLLYKTVLGTTVDFGWWIVADSLQQVSTTKTHKYNIETVVEGLLARTVSVLSNSGTGTQNITFTGGTSFIPKVAIVSWSASSTSVNTFQTGVSYGIGFTTDSTNQRCTSIASKDAADPTNTCSIHTDNALISTFYPAGTVTTIDAVAEFSSWLTNGMQITWSDAPTAQFYIHVLFLGGDDITDTKIGTLMSGTGTGNISDTSLSFQGDFGLFLTCSNVLNSVETAYARMSIGAATSSSNQWTQSIFSNDNVATSQTRQYYSHSNISATIGTTLSAQASFVSFNSNGFTININDAYPSSHPIFYLIIKGGSYAIGNDTEPASTGVQTITTNKDTKGVMIFGLDTSTADAVQLHNVSTIGMGTSSSEMGVDAHDDFDGNAYGINCCRHGTTRIYTNVTRNIAIGSSTLDDEATLSSVSSTGFDLNWTNVGQARPYRYIAFGNASEFQFYDKPISETTITISESLSRLQVLIKPIAETSVSVSESRTRLLILPRSISETAVTVGAGVVNRLLQALRTIPQTVIVSADTVTRLQSIFKTIAEPSISAIDSLVGAKFLLKTISETAVTVGADSVTRLQQLIKTIAEGAIPNITGTVTRLQSLIKTISETSVTVGAGAVLAPKNIGKTISETAVTVGAGLVSILQQLQRTIADSAITTTGSVSRLQSLIKSIAEGTVNVGGGSITAGRLLTGQVKETLIKWYYSVFTKKVSS